KQRVLQRATFDTRAGGWVRRPLGSAFHAQRAQPVARRRGLREGGRGTGMGTTWAELNRGAVPGTRRRTWRANCPAGRAGARCAGP
ncbi:MAG: hypothetical protein LC749_07940, partial [Actinobacteria bacterium]|nr:hypothetical protein [Actinomycetota bacterium]